MRKDIVEIIENKGKFIRAIEVMLDTDKDNHMVDSINYQIELQPGDDNCCDEVVNVIYRDGSVKKVLATGNSKERILKDIIKEVY